MGLLKPTTNYGHSFGIYGQAEKIGNIDPESISQVFPKSDMVDATSINKYLVVSVWANSWTAVTNTGSFTIKFSSSEWANFDDIWSAPPTPAAAAAPDIPVWASNLMMNWIGCTLLLGLN